MTVKNGYQYIKLNRRIHCAKYLYPRDNSASLENSPHSETTSVHSDLFGVTFNEM